MITHWSADAKRHSLKPPPCNNDDTHDNTKYYPFGSRGKTFWGENKVVEQVWKHKDRKIERR